MPNQPPDYQTAAEVLDRARALFGLADHELVRGTGSIPDADIPARLWRAQTYALVAAAGAKVAQAMMVKDDLDAAEELDQHLTALGVPLVDPPAKVTGALRERSTCPGPLYCAQSCDQHAVPSRGRGTDGS